MMGSRSTGLAVLASAHAQATSARRQRHLVSLAYRASAASTTGTVSAAFAVGILLNASPIPPHAGGMWAVAFLCRVRREYDV
jgi:hypothetical protein